MPRITTTYKYDYVDPKLMRTGKLTKNEKCECCESEKGKEPQIDLVKLAEDAEKSDGIKSEWTGIAPMGILINPRIIPETVYDDEKENECFESRPNKYLNNLPNADPDLYENLRNMNKDDLQKRVNTLQLKSTYQIDYGTIAEYSGGAYTPDDMQFKTSQSELYPDPCTEDILDKTIYQTGGLIKCELNYQGKPGLCLAHCPVAPKLGHWNVTNLKRSTEYQDNISRIGGIIIKQNIHSHKKCMLNNCNHPMTLEENI